jgi:hypothetical protein
LACVFVLTACAAPAPAATSVSVVSEHGLLQADVELGSVQRGDNSLFVMLRPLHDAGDARLVAVDAAMVAHAHEAHAGAIDAEAGGFRATDLDLFMTGRWLVVLELSLSGQDDSVSLPVDVP